MTTTSPRPAPPRTPLDVVVVGAGQAGLAVAHHLAGRGVRSLVLDAGPEIGHVWRSRWDSLTLFTPAEYCSLPGMPFPTPAGSYPTKDQVADYLAQYAERFELPVMLNTRVQQLTRAGEVYEIDTSQGTLFARQVVVATGPFQRPAIPAVARLLSAEVVQLHSSQYRNPDELPPGRVLVVGGGNSGLQIAAELTGTHQVHVAMGSRQTMVPQRPLGRDLFWWLTKTGLLSRPADSQVSRLFRRRGGDLVIGSSTKSLQTAGVELRGRLTQAHHRTVVFAEGDSLEVDAVVWATGFRSDYSWIAIPEIWDGESVKHLRGRTQVPGLSFIGLPWQHTRGSALLGFVKDDAAWLASQVLASSVVGQRSG